MMVLFWKQVHLQKEGTAGLRSVSVRPCRERIGGVKFEIEVLRWVVRMATSNLLALASVVRTARKMRASDIRVMMDCSFWNSGCCGKTMSHLPTCKARVVVERDEPRRCWELKMGTFDSLDVNKAGVPHDPTRSNDSRRHSHIKWRFICPFRFNCGFEPRRVQSCIGHLASSI